MIGRITLGVVMALVAAACARSPAESPTTGDTSPIPVTAADPASFPACDDVPRLSAPADAYGPEPIYVANEMPADEVREWAVTQPGFETIWIDREHNGWVTVAFSEDVEARQADLERLFPGEGVVAVAMPWNLAELHALQARVTSELGTFLDGYVTWTAATQGVVGIEVGVLTDDVRAELETRYAGQPICLDGRDPSTEPAPGPQQLGGDGWRLLVDEADAGAPYRTGIATDRTSLAGLWATIGLDDPPPEVDFTDEVVVWFGAVYSGSCPEMRLDDVVVDGSTLHAFFVYPNRPAVCTADARPRAYVVAVERSKLPPGPFVIQLDADDPPPGAPEERTVVSVDLSQPGAVAGPGEVGFDPSLPGRRLVMTGDVIEPDYPVEYSLYTHCGTSWLGEINDVTWYSDDPMPPEWQALVDTDQSLVVSVVLRVDPEPAIEATAGGVTVVYAPTSEPEPGCD